MLHNQAMHPRGRERAARRCGALDPGLEMHCSISVLTKKDTNNLECELQQILGMWVADGLADSQGVPNQLCDFGKLLNLSVSLFLT